MVGPVERNVNVVQEVLESVGTRVGRIIRIITRTVGEVAQEVSGVVADGFEIAEASKRARADHERWNAEDLVDAGVGQENDDEDQEEDDEEAGELVDLDDEGDAADEIDATAEEVTSGAEPEARDNASAQERV
ncbi:Hypothetical protein ERS075564_01814 [Mycobacteroides abscessus]|uniref:Uncharacterized protein n=3 Tax=Mycobacteroides abscessus TaxID=36809 RepID=A0A829HXN0_9MYCO|nr:hypothetical protein [Mycobacteroides abscessus]ESV59221.1 hypothetical protein L830_5073 [Mycobacteroides abscessus MAB_082312_2258]ESV62604.1 hypothetical protein L833_5009 [Mycobacteroides abscessus MAB_091912_2446]AIC72562.1 hypothetical protein MYCMA_10905 [Mycobacteroides abscessus subsp. massiliense str. GO 06]AMU25255.1 hypothetical protein A3N96_07350 [Mycobacteroides abscessus]AMU34983.1 hypothetical protein A3N98_06810 [Mycobacteroides abscessus]